MTLLPSQHYLQQCHALVMQRDEQQWQLVQQFDQLYLALLKKSVIIKKPVKGTYLWGGVGIGKTFLMDCFFETLPLSKKKRIHFHHFMADIHQALNRFLGHKNPLKLVAKEVAKEVRVLCLDEFFVKDIADAMVLAGLLDALFREGICLIITSNTPPHLLYKNGLQRQNFIPAICLLEQHTQVIHLASSEDYRTLHLKQNGLYYSPLGLDAETAIRKTFLLYAGDVFSTEPLTLLGREIAVLGRNEEVVWFDFRAICGVPRSQNDYLALVEHYTIIFISNIPVITDRNDATNFINFIDILYDAHVLLVMSAEKSPLELYPSGELLAEFERTQSRLIEMQSEFYIKGKKHA